MQNVIYNELLPKSQLKTSNNDLKYKKPFDTNIPRYSSFKLRFHIFFYKVQSVQSASVSIEYRIIIAFKLINEKKRKFEI